MGAGLAAVLLPLLGYGSGRVRTRASGLGGLVLLVVLVGGALLAEHALVTGELPRLLRGGGLRP